MQSSNYARLGLYEMPLVSWKGKTFAQVTAPILNNAQNPVNGVDYIRGSNIYMKPLPLKIFRKEIASKVPDSCSSRASIRIREFIDAPGANIVNSKESALNCGIVNTIDMTLPFGETPYPNAACNTAFDSTDPNVDVSKKCLSTANNALRRVRSAGMIKKTFNVNKNNDTYYTSTNQYLYSRNKKFDQNQYHSLRLGDKAATPGAPGSLDNVYASGTPTHCADSNGPNAFTSAFVPVYYKPSNSEFAVQGGVSASEKILRVKYNTITKGGSALRSYFGDATANALAYSTEENKNTVKDRLGYPAKKTPVFCNYSNNYECQFSGKFKR